MSWLQYPLGNRNNPEQPWCNSIPGYVIKKNRSRGAKHGASERPEMYFNAKQVLKKPDMENMEAILRYSLDGTPMKNTRSHFLSSDRRNTSSYCRTGLLGDAPLQGYENWKNSACVQLYSYSRFWRRNSASTQRPDYPQAKKNANDCMTSTWQASKKNTWTFLTVNK